jgi:hypothetical protein
VPALWTIHDCRFAGRRPRLRCSGHSRRARTRRPSLGRHRSHGWRSVGGDWWRLSSRVLDSMRGRVRRKRFRHAGAGQLGAAAQTKLIVVLVLLAALRTRDHGWPPRGADSLRGESRSAPASIPRKRAIIHALRPRSRIPGPAVWAKCRRVCLWRESEHFHAPRTPQLGSQGASRASASRIRFESESCPIRSAIEATARSASADR